MSEKVNYENLAAGGSQIWYICLSNVGAKCTTLAKPQSQIFTLKVAIKSLLSLHSDRRGGGKQQQVDQQKSKQQTQILYSKERQASSNQSSHCGVGGVTVRVHYLFGRLLLFHTVPNYNIHYFPAKPLHYAFKATLFSCKKNK